MDHQALSQYLQSLPTKRNTCLKQLTNQQQQEIKRGTALLNQGLIVYDLHKETFNYQTVILIPNIILIENDYVALSTTTISKLVITQHEQSLAGIHLQNQIGSLFLFFRLKQQFYEWITKLKCYCKLTNFSAKYKLLEQIMKDFYIVQHKKSKKCYTCQLYRVIEYNDYIYNEIQILRTIKHPCFLDLKWVYEDNKNIYLVFDYFRAEKLQDLLNQGLQLDQTQIAYIILQLLQAIKCLNKNQIYHGNITPNNILINTESSTLQIYLINFVNVVNLLSYNQNQKLDGYFKQVFGAFIAPEILAKQLMPSIDTDLYQIGAVLYYLTYFTTKRKQETAQLEFINYKIIEDSIVFIQGLETQTTQKGIAFFQLVKYRHLFSISQIDLMQRLLLGNARIKLEEALKHQWFINVKQRIKPNFERKKKSELPSLRTIIELCEQSELEVKLFKTNNNNQDDLVIDEENHIGQMMEEMKQRTQIMKLPSKENHERCKYFAQLKSTVDKEYPDSSNKDYVNFKTFS